MSRLAEISDDPDVLDRMRVSALDRARPEATSRIAADVATLLPEPRSAA